MDVSGVVAGYAYHTIRKIGCADGAPGCKDPETLLNQRHCNAASKHTAAASYCSYRRSDVFVIAHLGKE